MSEGFTVETRSGGIAGIVVRQKGERGFRFHASLRRFEALDGHVFVSPAAAQKAASEFDTAWLQRRKCGAPHVEGARPGVEERRQREADYWALVPAWL